MAGESSPSTPSSAPATTPSDNKTTPATAAPAPPVADASRKPAADTKKDRKPRRERLPLPDPIPDTPVKRLPEPIKADLQAKIEAEDKKIQACFDRLDSSRQLFDERQKLRDASKPAFEAARKAFNELSDECRVLFEKRKEISAKLKEIKEADYAARNAANSAASALVGAGKDGAEALRGIRNMEDLEKRVEELNSRHSTESVSLVLEKKIVAQIDFLNGKGRDFINSKEESYQAERAAKEQRVISRKRLDEERNQLDTQIDAAKGKLDKQRLVVDKIRAEQDSKIKKLQESTPDVDRDAEKKTINELKSVVRKLRDNFQDELDKWYLNERIHFEQQKVARKKKAEAMQAERDQRRKEWEAEQAQYPEPDPYQEEKDMCDGLILYTRTLLGETVEKPSVNLAPGKGQSAPTLKTTTNTREITAEGKAIGKSSFAKNSGFDNLLFSDFVQKSGKKGKKARRAAALSGDTSAEAGDTPLKPHSIDYIAAFATLDITPPNKMGEVRAALEAVLAKKAYYDSKPKPTDEEKAQMAAEKSKKRSAPVSEKKPKSKAVDIMNGDATAAFPGLGADKSTVSPSPTAPVEVTRPTACYSAAVKGSAPAPSPIVPAQSDLAPQVGALDEVATEAVMESGEATVANDVGKDDLLTSAPDASVTNA